MHCRAARPLWSTWAPRNCPLILINRNQLGHFHSQGGETIVEHLDTEEVVDKLPTDQIAPPVPEVVRCACVGGYIGWAGAVSAGGAGLEGPTLPDSGPPAPEVVRCAGSLGFWVYG